MNKTLNYTDNKSLKSIWQIGVKLFIICVVAALCLGIINQFTGRAIKERQQREKNAIITSLAKGNTIGDIKITNNAIVSAYYPVYRSTQITAYILELTGTGYGGTMKIIAMYEPTGKILNARLVEHNETPGLGDKAADPVYMRKFAGTGAAEPVPVTKEMLVKHSKNARQAYLRPVYNSFSEWLFGQQVSASGADVADSVSGATITFKGVSQALASGALFVRTMRGNN